MCQCIECVGDQPEPLSILLPNGKWIIKYKSTVITREHETENEAWEEADSLPEQPSL